MDTTLGYLLTAGGDVGVLIVIAVLLYRIDRSIGTLTTRIETIISHALSVDDG